MSRSVQESEGHISHLCKGTQPQISPSLTNTSLEEELEQSSFYFFKTDNCSKNPFHHGSDCVDA